MAFRIHYGSHFLKYFSVLLVLFVSNTLDTKIYCSLKLLNNEKLEKESD